MTNELDITKKAATVDELINHRFDSVAGAFNEQFERMYKDFNLTLEKQYKDIRRIEISFANTINILFGMLNDEKIKNLSLQNVLERGGLDLNEFEEEYALQKKKLVESGEWKEHPLDKTFGQPVDTQPKPSDEGLIL